MGGWLKALIATACVVIIAGGAYLAWSEYSAHQEREAAEYRALVMRACEQRVRVAQQYRDLRRSVPEADREQLEVCLSNYPHLRLN